MAKEPQDEATIAAKKAMFERLRSCFPSARKDIEIAKIMGVNKQVIVRYKTGENIFNIITISQRFPELDWNYIITGAATDKDDKKGASLQKELRENRKAILELANNLQKIEDKITTK